MHQAFTILNRTRRRGGRRRQEEVGGGEKEELLDEPERNGASLSRQPIRKCLRYSVGPVLEPAPLLEIRFTARSPALRSI